MVKRVQQGQAATQILTLLADGRASTVAELAATLDMNHRQVTNGAAKLLQRGYLMRLADGRLQLTVEGIAAAAAGEVIKGSSQSKVRGIRDTFRDRAWRAMRFRRRFTVGEIVSDAVRAGDGQPEDNARRYISRLKRAGYVGELPNRRQGTALSSNGFKQFVLLKNTGPRAPVWREALAVLHDFNTGEDVLCAPA